MPPQLQRINGGRGRIGNGQMKMSVALLGRSAVITLEADDASEVDLATTVNVQRYIFGTPISEPFFELPGDCRCIR